MSTFNDALLKLIEASLEANYSDVRKASNILAKELSDENLDLAKKIKAIVRRKGVPLRASGYLDKLPSDSKSKVDLLEETQWPVTPIFLDEESMNVFSTFIEDVYHIEKLIKYGLNGRLNFLLSGPPGTGKSLVAGHLAAKLHKPLYTVRLDSVISSLLGDTAKNIRSIFEFSASNDCVIFLDEVDAVAKLRDDKHEIGELKRVVNTLIQGLDSLDDRSVVIAATNHSKLLDPAIWRRFPYVIQFGEPDYDLRTAMWEHFLFRDDEGRNAIAGLLAKVSHGLTGADIEGIANAAKRRSVLESEPINIPRVVVAVLNSLSGRVSIPGRGALETDKKREVASKLSSKFKLTQAEIAKLLFVSRQAVSNYLKGSIHA